MNNFSNFQHFVGCDVSKATLDFAIYERGKDYRQFEHIQVSNDLDGFRKMRKWLRSFKIKIQEAVIAMEHTGFYSIALAEWCHKNKITFVMLHPADVKRACTCGRNKTDKADSQFIADYVYTMREKLTPSSPESPLIKRLRELMNERSLAVRSRVAYLNQKRTVTDPTALKRIEKAIADFDLQKSAIEKAIKKIINSDEKLKQNYNLLCSVPGIGIINAVMTIIATGNFTRFQTARQYAKFCCISPLTHQSGTSVKGKSHVSQAGHHKIKALLSESAQSAVLKYAEFKTFYERKIAQGKSYGCVMNAVKFKLICRMFSVIERQTPYVKTDRFRA